MQGCRDAACPLPLGSRPGPVKCLPRPTRTRAQRCTAAAAASPPAPPSWPPGLHEGRSQGRHPPPPRRRSRCAGTCAGGRWPAACRASGWPSAGGKGGRRGAVDAMEEGRAEKQEPVNCGAGLSHQAQHCAWPRFEADTGQGRELGQETRQVEQPPPPLGPAAAGLTAACASCSCWRLASSRRHTTSPSRTAPVLLNMGKALSALRTPCFHLRESAGQAGGRPGRGPHGTGAMHPAPPLVCGA